MKAELRMQGAGFDVSVRLGDEVAKPTGGGAEWDEVKRPEDVSLTDYTGDGLVHLDVPVLLDGWRAGADQQPALNAILSLTRGGATGRAPDFIATGPIPYSGLRCVMEAPDWGDTMRAPPPDGRLLRQELTLHLIEFVDPNAIAVTPKRPGAGGGAAVFDQRQGTVKTKANETLLQVSTRVYGTPSRAQEIGQLNGIRDVRKKLKAGLLLRLSATTPRRG